VRPPDRPVSSAAWPRVLETTVYTSWPDTRTAESMSRGAPVRCGVRRCNRRLPLHRTVVHVAASTCRCRSAQHHSPAITACGAAQRQARHRCSWDHSSVPVRGTERMQLPSTVRTAIRRSEMALAPAPPRSGALPANRTVGGVEGKELPVARTHQHQLAARSCRRTAVRGCAHARDMAEVSIDGHDIPRWRRRKTSAGDRESEPQPRARLLRRPLRSGHAARASWRQGVASGWSMLLSLNGG